jgi:hypothetical protein
MRVVSYGGGVQSTALLALAAQDKIPHRTFLFSNVGDDSEHPTTLRYVREVAVPFAEAHGIELIELHRVRRDGTPETLWEREMRPSRSIGIPARVTNGAPGNRSCTADFKIKVLGKWMRDHGATKDNPATVALGISVDEIERARPGIDPQAPYQFREYPLLDMGLQRNPDCRDVIEAVGLPVPPKSACFFCPFHDKETWRAQRRDEPDLFAKSVQLEEAIVAKRATLGKDPMWLTRHGRPLIEVVDEQAQLPGMDGCDSGWCWT